MNSKFLLLLLFVLCIGASVHASTIILDENFQVDFQGWGFSQGGFSIVTNHMQSNSANSTASHAIVYPTLNFPFTASTQMSVTTDGNAQFCFNEFDSNPNGDNCSSYNIIMDLGSSTMKFRRNTTVLTSVQAISSGTQYDINIVHAIDGNFTIYVNNALKASVIDTTDDINGVYAKIIYQLGSAGFGRWGYTSIITPSNFFSLIINQPIDEQTNQLIPGGFDFSIFNTLNVINQTVFPYNTFIQDLNTIYSMSIVDHNAPTQQYYTRNYIIQSNGNQGTVTIQPYLIKIANAILVNITVKDIFSEQTIPNIRAKLQKNIGGKEVTVEDLLTNGAGIGEFSLVNLNYYALTISTAVQDFNYFSGSITSATQAYTTWINFNSSTFGSNAHDYNYFLGPTGLFVQNSISNHLDLNANFPITAITIKVFDLNKQVNQITSTSLPFVIDLTTSLQAFDSNNVSVQVIVQPTNDRNFVINQQYTIGTGPTDVVSSLRRLKQSISVTSLFSLVIIIGLCFIVLLGNSIFGNNDAQVFAIVLFTGILWFIFFQDQPTPFIVAVVLAAFAYLWSRSVK